MLLSQITIEKLFGTFDYRIELKPDGLTVLIGPNGYGKTTILRMIDAIAKKNLFFFIGVNFKKITFEFDDKRFVAIEKVDDTKLRYIVDDKEHDINLESLLDRVIRKYSFASESYRKLFDLRTERPSLLKDIARSNTS